MKPKIDISPADLRDFVKHRGWQQVNEAIKDREYLFNHPDTPRQLYFPMDREVADFSDSIWMTIEKLAAFDSMDTIQMLRRIEEARDDTLAFRLFGESSDDSFVPFGFVKSMLKGAEGLLLSSTHTILKPQIFHPRMNRAEGRRLIEATRFRHTEPGSFIMKVSCPIHALESEGDAQIELLDIDETAPFVRKVTSLIHKSLSKIVQSIEADTVGTYIEEEKRSQAPTLSYNICDAVGGFSEGRRSLELRPQWSILRPTSEDLQKSIRIANDYFPRFQEIAKELKPREKEVEDTFIGTVEELEGTLDDDGNRSGDVVLHILIPDGDPIRARVNLDVDQYKIADQAHMNGRTPYVKLRGRLRPGNQPQRISNLSLFQPISSTD
jgi:hypothetical protein